MRWFASLLTVIVVSTAGTSLAEAPGRRPVVVKPLLSTDRNSADQPIVFPRTNGHVTAAIFEIAPGATLPVHKHPFPRLGYVLAGTLRVNNAETGRSATYRAGDFVLESVDIWHNGENIGPEMVRLLVVDLSEGDAPTTIMKR